MAAPPRRMAIRESRRAAIGDLSLGDQQCAERTNIIMTPPRLVELKCPNCQGRHWTIDSDFRAAFMAGGVDLEYEQREYACPNCGRQGSGHEVLQKSPPEFFLQPHQMYPMSQSDFDHWLAILKEHFPGDPRLREVGISWYPGER